MEHDISRFATGIRTLRKTTDKPIMHRSSENKPRIQPRQKGVSTRKNSRFQKVPRAAECISGRTRADGLVREVGFEPTNPYGTGASGLRFHDP